MAEAEVFAEEDPEKVERAQERYDDFVAKAEEVLEKIEAQKSNDGNRSIRNMGMIARIQNKFERHREHTGEIYIRALERFRKNNASEGKIERFENFYERALNRSDRMEARILQKREAAIERHKVIAGKSDEELEEIIGEIESGEGLVKARERRLEKLELRAERVITVHELGLENARIRLENSGLSGEQKLKVQSEIGKLDKRLDAFKERSAGRIQVTKGKLGEAEILGVEVTEWTNKDTNKRTIDV